MNIHQSFDSMLILDFTRCLPGGYATQVLADLGAEVVKVEGVNSGDPIRYNHPLNEAGLSYCFSVLGRNKKSVALDLKDDEVADHFLNLVEQVDVIVENFRPGVMERLGIDYKSVKAINPSIVYCSISSYGSQSDDSKQAQDDLNMQARSGYLSLNDANLSPIHLCDLSSAMVACQAILAALLERSLTGEGAYIDISMFDCFMWWNSLIDSRWAFDGKECAKKDLAFPMVNYNTYETKDGEKLAIGMIEKKFWERFCDLIEYPELKEAHGKRAEESPYAHEIVSKVVALKTMSEWQEWLVDKNLCIEAVVDKTTALERMIREHPETLCWVNFPDAGRALQTRLPHNISSLLSEIDAYTQPVKLGENTSYYLQKAGCSQSDIERLESLGVVALGKAMDSDPS